MTMKKSVSRVVPATHSKSFDITVANKEALHAVSRGQGIRLGHLMNAAVADYIGRNFPQYFPGAPTAQHQPTP